MKKPAIAAIVEIEINKDTASYRTNSYLEVAKEFNLPENEIPRDVILAMVYELEVLIDRITKRGEITDEEMAEYISEREIVSKEDTKKSGIKPKDEIDNTIDHLFDDDN